VIAPRLSIAPLGIAKRDGEGWRTTWRVANPDADSFRIVTAVAPHSQFRGETALDREVRGKASTQFLLVVRIEGGAHTEALTPRFGAVYRDLLADFFAAALAAD